MTGQEQYARIMGIMKKYPRKDFQNTGIGYIVGSIIACAICPFLLIPFWVIYDNSNNDDYQVLWEIIGAITSIIIFGIINLGCIIVTVETINNIKTDNLIEVDGWHDLLPCAFVFLEILFIIIVVSVKVFNKYKK